MLKRYVEILGIDKLMGLTKKSPVDVQTYMDVAHKAIKQLAADGWGGLDTDAVSKALLKEGINKSEFDKFITELDKWTVDDWEHAFILAQARLSGHP